MVEQLHRMIDAGSAQVAINERIAGLLEGEKKDLTALATLVSSITSDHERRIRYLERSVAWALGGVGTISAMILIIKQFVK